MMYGHVVLYLPHLRCGGAEMAFVRLADGLHEAGIPVEIVVHALPGADETWLETVVPVHALEVASTSAAIPALARLLRRSRPAVLVSALTHNNIAALAAKAMAGGATRVVVTEHAPVTNHVRMSGGWRYRVLPAMLPSLYRWADALVPVSQGIRDDLALLGCSHRHMEVIHNPVLPTGWRWHAATVPDDPWLVPDAPPFILAAGRLSPEKDFTTLLDAFRLVRERRPDLRLMILGEGPERPTLEAEARRLGIAQSVRLPGFRSDLMAYMRHASVFALSSLYEGFGNVLVEALASGRPVVSTDCPVGPREILEDGKWGRLVPVGGAAAMADALLNSLADPGDPVAFRLHAEHFTTARAVQAYLRLFTAIGAHPLDPAA